MSEPWKMCFDSLMALSIHHGKCSLKSRTEKDVIFGTKKHTPQLLGDSKKGSYVDEELLYAYQFRQTIEPKITKKQIF